MAKDLRTKINELPICEDMELIDTLIAIGTDGKTYRVNKDNVGGKVNDWIFLNYSIAGEERDASRMSIRIDCTQFDELFNTYDDNGLKYINCEYIENYNNTNVNGFLITSKINENTMFLPTFVDDYEIRYNSSTFEHQRYNDFLSQNGYCNTMGYLGGFSGSLYDFNNIRAVCK